MHLRPGTSIPNTSRHMRWLVMGPFLVVAVLLAAVALASTQIQSIARIYVGSESQWAKGQRDAVYALANYIESGRDADLRAFDDAMRVPLGDRRARLELDRAEPDRAVARQGLIDGRVQPDDVDTLIWLFRSLRHVGFMADAIDLWAEADGPLEALTSLAREVRETVGPRARTAPDRAALRERLARINAELVDIEQRFADAESDAARIVQGLVQIAILVFAVPLTAAAAWFSSASLRRLSRTETELRTSEERFRLLWNTAPDAIVILDRRLNICFANAAVETLFGHPHGAIIGQDVGILLPHRLRAPLRASIATMLAGPPPVPGMHDAELVGVRLDGSEFPVELAFSQREGGGEQRIAAFVRDISARKQAERSLHASEERLQRVLESPDLCLWDFDVESGDVFLSESWSRLMGGPAEAIHTSYAELLDIVPESEQGEVLRAWQTALMDPLAGYRVEHRVRTLTGEWRWILSEGRVVERDVHGEALRIVGTNRDISALKHHEAQRSALEEQLRESQKMEAVGTLAGGIAHDFNNILGAILGHLALVRDEVGAAHASEHNLAQMQTAALRARGLVQQILAFSRRQPQELVVRHLQPLVQETVALLRSTLPAGVQIETRLCVEPIHALTDATQLQQVLMNLCMNAWHALQGRHGRIVVGLESTEGALQPPHGAAQPIPSAHLWVSDTGCGMDVATRERIFEPFFTTKELGEGTGLGLSVVHGIVTAHRGAITVDSSPGRGSSFHIYLPAAQAHAPPPADSDWVPLDPLARAGDGQRVAYVDDDEVMLLMVEQLLVRLGYRPQCFSDPRRAVEALRAQPGGFDLLLSDYNMPEFSGLDVAREAAAIRADLPVVISSGRLSDEERGELLRLGVRATLRKENTLDDLGPMLARLLTAPPGSKAAARGGVGAGADSGRQADLALAGGA